MDVKTLVQEFVKSSHGIYQSTLAGLTQEQADRQPGGACHSIAADIAHLATAEDFLINGLGFGKQPLALSAMEGKTGLSELPPRGDWGAWAKTVQVDLSALRAYQQAVFANTEAIIEGLTDDDLNRVVDMTALNFGQVPMPLFLLMFAGAHTSMHTGEISALKGQQGLQGYPF